jgi:hypothetical protein
MSGNWPGRCEVAHEADRYLPVECPPRCGGHLRVAGVRPPLPDRAAACDRAALGRRGVFLGGALEVLFLAASVALATGGLWWGFRRHRRWQMFIVLGAALTMIAAGRFLARESFELVFVIMGAAVLAGGHLLNRYLCLTCRVCEGEDARGGS